MLEELKVLQHARKETFCAFQKSSIKTIDRKVLKFPLPALMKSKKRLFYITQYAAMLRNGRLLLLRDTDCDGTHPALKGKWIFPGGHIDTELDPIKALKREIKEELDMKLKSAFPIRTEIKLYPTGYRFVVYYRTEAAGKIRLSEEHDAYKWVSLKDVKKMRFRDAQEKNVVEDILRSRQ